MKCPACQRRLKIASADPGIKVGCPACRAPFTLGSRTGSSGHDFVAFELFDTDVALDDVPVYLIDNAPALGPKAVPEGRLLRPSGGVAAAKPITKASAAPLLKPGDLEHPIGDGHAQPSSKRRRERDDDDEYDDELAEMLGIQDWGEPRYQKSWNLVYWGLTLVLFSVLLYGGGIVTAFIALAYAVGSADAGALGLLAIAFMLVVGTDFLRLAGYGMCLAVPGKTSARSYVWIAIGMALTSMAGGLFRVVVSFMDPFLAANIIAAISAAVGFMSFLSFLMFMETIADMNKERGIADSVSGVIKLGSTWGLTLGVGMGIQVGVGYWVAAGSAPRWLNPTSGDASLYVVAAIGSCYTAFIGILGLVVFIKFIFAVLNVRKVVQENI